MIRNLFLPIFKTAFLIFITLSSIEGQGQQSERIISIFSPNQQNLIEINNKNGVLCYQVVHNGEVVIDSSSLGFILKYQNVTSNKVNLNHSFVIEKSTSNTFHDSWKPVWGTDSLIENWYNESTIFVSNKIIPDLQLKIIVRAYNDGVAFRYHLENISTHRIDSVYIFEELTQFNFASNDSAWFAPAADFAYESVYKQLPLSEIKDAATPITICRNNQLTIAIHEAMLVNYSEIYLANITTGKPHFISKLWPEPDGVCARVSLPFQTPWRVILITETPGELIESHLIQNLNEPSKIVETDWIQPIKFIGIWWGMHIGQYTWMQGEKHGATTERTKQYIDFAAKHNIGGVLAEGWNEGWETWNSVDFPLQNFSKEYPDFNLKEVTSYAKSKNVHFVSHHETGGNIPEYERQLDSALKLCNQLGIKYLKTGYAGKIIPVGYPHHGQYMVNHFQKVVEKAAQYQICLNVHESIKPTGLDRTWPNLMSQEAIRGNEWNGGYKPTPPSHTTILPFTRFVAGPADYTPGIFNTKHSPDKGKRLFTTRAHQMALMVVFFSPMAMVSDNIENYEDQPEFKFMEEVPCSWDATKVLSCEIGKFVSIARKKDQKWFIGTITNQDCRMLSIPLHFLDANQSYLVTIYGDGFTNDWKNNPDQVEIAEYIIKSTDSITISMSQGSGNVMVFEPIDNDYTNNNSIDFFNSDSKLKFQLYSQKVFLELGQMVNKHKGYLCKTEYKTAYNQKYSGEGNIGLTNGKLGNYNFFEEWQGFEGTNIELRIDLDSLKEISSVEVRFLDAINDWIFAPKSVTLWISGDGDRFEKGETIFLTGNELRDYNVIEVEKAIFSFSKKGVRAIKITTESQTKCPDWHYGSGKSCWTFMDEIIMN